MSRPGRRVRVRLVPEPWAGAVVAQGGAASRDSPFLLKTGPRAARRARAQDGPALLEPVRAPDHRRARRPHPRPAQPVREDRDQPGHRRARPGGGRRLRHLLRDEAHRRAAPRRQEPPRRPPPPGGDAPGRPLQGRPGGHVRLRDVGARDGAVGPRAARPSACPSTSSSAASSATGSASTATPRAAVSSPRRWGGARRRTSRSTASPRSSSTSTTRRDPRKLDRYNWSVSLARARADGGADRRGARGGGTPRRHLRRLPRPVRRAGRPQDRQGDGALRPHVARGAGPRRVPRGLRPHPAGDHDPDLRRRELVPDLRLPPPPRDRGLRRDHARPPEVRRARRGPAHRQPRQHLQRAVRPPHGRVLPRRHGLGPRLRLGARTSSSSSGRSTSTPTRCSRRS